MRRRRVGRTGRTATRGGGSARRRRRGGTARGRWPAGRRAGTASAGSPPSAWRPWLLSAHRGGRPVLPVGMVGIEQTATDQRARWYRDFNSPFFSPFNRFQNSKASRNCLAGLQEGPIVSIKPTANWAAITTSFLVSTAQWLDSVRAQWESGRGRAERAVRC